MTGLLFYNCLVKYSYFVMFGIPLLFKIDYQEEEARIYQQQEPANRTPVWTAAVSGSELVSSPEWYRFGFHGNSIGSKQTDWTTAADRESDLSKFYEKD